MRPSLKSKTEGPSIEEIKGIKALVEKLPLPHSFEIDRLVGLILKENLSSERKIYEKPHLSYLWNNELGGYTLPCDLRVIDDVLYFFPPLVDNWQFVMKKPTRGDHSPFIETVSHSEMANYFQEVLGIKDISRLDTVCPQLQIGKERNVYHHLVITPQQEIKLVIYGAPTARQKNLLSQLEKRWQGYGIKFRAVVVTEKNIGGEIDIIELSEVRPLIWKVEVNTRYSLSPPYTISATRDNEGRIILRAEHRREEWDIIYGVGIFLDTHEGSSAISITIYFTPYAHNHEQVVSHFIANECLREGKGVLKKEGDSLVITDKALIERYKKLKGLIHSVIRIEDVELGIKIRAYFDFLLPTPILKLEAVMQTIHQSMDKKEIEEIIKEMLRGISREIKNGQGLPPELEKELNTARVSISVYFLH